MDTETIALPDGQRLGLIAAGPKDGWPIFFFHGFGSSRLSCHPDETVPVRLNVRLIAVDRPGIGLSDPGPPRSVLSWGGSVGRLADALGFEQFSVLGWSGGGPHALAVARALGDRVASIGLIASTVSLDDPGARAALPFQLRLTGRLARAAPWLIRFSLRVAGRRIRRHPEDALKALWLQLSAADRRVLDTPQYRDAMLRATVEAWRRGSRGIAEDALAIGRPWGFRLRDVSTPVQVWHGEADRVVPPRVGRYLATALPAALPHFVADAGHLMHFEHWADMLQTLRDAVRR